MKILIIDDLHEAILPMLSAVGISANYQPNITPKEVLEQIPDYEGIILRSKIAIDAHFLQQAPKLRLIARAGSGLDQIDLAEAKRRNIQLLNAPEGNRDAVAEHTVGLLLSLLNKLKVANEQVRQKKWQREANRGTELKEKTVAIIGYGNVGKEVARRLSSFGCKILAFDRKLKNYADTFAQEATMKIIFAEADIVSLHVSLNEDSRNLVNEAYLDSFRKDILLINTSRGEVLNLTDLAFALKKGKVWAAGLDVLDNEKLQTLNPEQDAVFEYLSNHPNVLLTPHIAGWTVESYKKISTVLGEKIQDWKTRNA